MIKVNFGEQSYSVEQDTLDRQSEGWNQVLKSAEKFGLIHAASGGVAILVHPQTQLNEGIYAKCQVATGNKHRITKLEER